MNECILDNSKSKYLTLISIDENKETLKSVTKYGIKLNIALSQ